MVKQKYMKVGIIMGSKSDLGIMEEAANVLKELGVEYELTVVSAHRTPERMFEYASKAIERGFPIKSSNSIDGWDSVLSILQMPNGIPVATVALNAAKNAGILAAQILAVADENIAKNVIKFKNDLKAKIEESAEDLKMMGFPYEF